MLGFWEGESRSAWSELGTSHMWKVTPAQEVNDALPNAVLGGLLSSISFHTFFPSYVLQGQLFDKNCLEMNLRELLI